MQKIDSKEAAGGKGGDAAGKDGAAGAADAAAAASHSDDDPVNEILAAYMKNDVEGNSIFFLTEADVESEQS